ncbi:hypothetical protein AAC387_Pa11g0275 [Persea americana]
MNAAALQPRFVTSTDSRKFLVRDLRDMVSQRYPSRRDHPSIKCSSVPLDLSPIELVDNGQADNVNSRKSNNILSTTGLVVAAGRIWNFLNQPSDILEPKENLKQISACKNTSVTSYSDGNAKASILAGTEYYSIDLKFDACFPLAVKSGLKHPKITQKMLLSEPCIGENNSSSLRRGVQAGNSHEQAEFWKIDGHTSLGIAHDLGRIYGCMCQNPFYNSKDLLNFTKKEYKKPAERSILENRTSVEDETTLKCIDCRENLLPKITRDKDPVGNESSASVENVQRSVSSLHTAYSLGTVMNLESAIISRIPSSSLYTDYHLKFLASTNCSVENCQQLSETCGMVVETSEAPCLEDAIVLRNQKFDYKGALLEDDTPINAGLSMHKKPGNILANQKHAIAGALAGTFVSLCLHPVDTIKTVIQARIKNEQSIPQIFRSIVSERGVTGLYRGISSNIASSAPISAVYTFTYESVKGALLPLLPKEYHSFAHCTAGGCASIATSFIFTPSEHIKQQMQVGSRYQNCWTVLVGILEKGGLPSLYAGWGAVLWRNIPHSIIKFYTYESLKQLMLSSSQPSAHPSLQMLLCGGLAASTAALFTTPFDVVKTRLQTQIPGSLKQYRGVLHCLTQIAKQEGLKGLYRGLMPRLVMYMSQGAIFFASYEFFKSMFSFEILQVPTQVLDNKEK